MIKLRPDLSIIADAIAHGTRVLDIGCGDGTLLNYLADYKNVDARGIEISREGVSTAVARGLSVIQGNADTDLADYPTASFDVVVLSQTLQATQKPDAVLAEMLRIGKRAIVSFPNFGYWRARLSVAVQGRMPVTAALPVEWYETTNIHLCTIADFEKLCEIRGFRIEKAIYLVNGQPSSRRLLANLLAEQGLFILSSDSSGV